MGHSVRYLYSDMLVFLVTIVDDIGWGRGRFGCCAFFVRVQVWGDWGVQRGVGEVGRGVGAILEGSEAGGLNDWN